MIGKGLQLLLPPGAGMSHSYSSQPPLAVQRDVWKDPQVQEQRFIGLAHMLPSGCIVYTDKGI